MHRGAMNASSSAPAAIPAPPMPALGRVLATAGRDKRWDAAIADPAATPLGTWRSLPQAVRESATLSAGVEKPALAIIKSGRGARTAFSAFPLTIDPRGGAPVAIEGAEAGVDFRFSPAKGATQAGGLRAVVDGANFAQYFRGRDIPSGAFELSLAARLSGDGVPQDSTLINGLVMGNESGYGSADRAIAAGAPLTSGTEQGPATVFRADDSRYYLLDTYTQRKLSQGSYTGIPAHPLFEGRAADRRVVVEPAQAPFDGARMHALVDGSYVERFPGT